MRWRYGKMREMAKKRKKQGFSKVETVKAMARERIGSPPPSRIVPGKKRKEKTEKHKQPMERLLDEG
jgi:hypothetical protein